MTLQKPVHGSAERVFVPVEPAASPEDKQASRPCLPLRWPTSAKERKAAFEAWHAIAMQVCNEAQASFRVMAVVERFVHWSSGTFWATNETLARYAGQCSVRTIKRDLATLSDLGIFIVTLGWRRSSSGKIVRSRLIRLAIPIDLPPETWIPGQDHGDNSCPHEVLADAGDHGDNSCPDHGDNSCPFTLEETLEEGA